MKTAKQHNYNEAAYLEAAQAYCIITWACGKKLVISRPLKKYANNLAASGWCRIHRSYMVNPLFVKQISADREFICLESGQKLPISRWLKSQVILWRQQFIN